MPPSDVDESGLGDLQFFAQRLNNRACSCITFGDYDEGIASLTRALEMTEKINFLCPLKSSCRFKCCNLLERCLKANLDSSPSTPGDNYGASRYPLFLADCAGNDQGNGMNYDQVSKFDGGNEEGEGFIYKRPVYVSAQSIEEGHNMGIVLSLLIVFNLALAHQLKAVSTDGITYESLSTKSLSATGLSILKQSIRLYELAYQIHITFANELVSYSALPSIKRNASNNGSLRFTMIVSNNLAEIHRIAGNTTKHKKCLNHLLSTILCMVESNVFELDSRQMDGFYKNVIGIVLRKNCAQAA